jgi:hypothetical protein
VWLKMSGDSFLPKTAAGPGGAERVTSLNESL